MILRTGLLLSILFLWASYTLAQPMAYVPGQGGIISVIDTDTNMVVDTIDIGDEDANGAVVTPDGTKVYAPVGPSDEVVVIQTSTNTILTRISVGNNPSDVAISHDGTTAWVTNFSGGANLNVSRIDTATDTVTATVDVGNCPPQEVLVTPPDTNGDYFVYVRGASTCDDVFRIDPATNMRIGPTINFGANNVPLSMDIIPDGSKIYVGTGNFLAGIEADFIFIINIAADGTPSLDPMAISLNENLPVDIAAAPVGNNVWAMIEPGDDPVFRCIFVIINSTDNTFVCIAPSMMFPDQRFSNVGFLRDGSSFYASTINLTGSVQEVDNGLPINFIGDPIDISIALFLRSPYFIGPDTALLAVTKTGDGDGTVTADPAGIDCGDTCEARYPIGTEVTLSAVPDGISEFLGWSGPEDCMDGVVTVDDNITCTADFGRTQYSVDVMIEPPDGGSVTTTPAGIDCPALSCSELFDQNANIMLNETPDPDFNFTGWTGDADCEDGEIQDLTADTSCTANFVLKRFDVIIAKKGNGIGNVTSVPAGIDCPFDCSQDFVIHTFVNLIATPDADSDFLGWAGDPNCEDGIIQDLTEDTTCEPTFNLKQFTLTVGKIGDGEGTVRSEPAGIDCGDDCSEVYNINTVVTLTPTPRFVSKFVGWTGDPDCSDGAVTMNRDIMCTAEFMSTAPPPLSADVSVVKTGEPDPVEAGSELTYSFDINNSGPNAATGVKLSDVLPEGVSFVSASQGCGIENGNVTCSIDTLSVSETKTFSVVVIPESPGNLMNSATVKAATPDPNPTNNTSTITTQVVGDVTAFLSVNATVETINTVPGGMFAIPVDVSNPDIAQTNSVTTTKQTADGVVFTVDLPEGFDIEALGTTVGSCNINTLQCTIGDIQPGEVVTVLVDAIASDEDGVFNVSFSASTSDGQVFSGNATVDVGGTVVVDGSGGGGCALSSTGQGRTELLGLFAPFIFLTFMLVVRRRTRVS